MLNRRLLNSQMLNLTAAYLCTFLLYCMGKEQKSSTKIFSAGVLFGYRFLFREGLLDHLSKGRSGFRDRVFPGVARVKGIELNKLLHSQTDFNNLLDDDAVRVCLLLVLDFVFMGFELRHVISNQVLNLVNDFSAWDSFPWGQYIWEEFHKMFKEQDVIPRSVAWSDRTPFLKCDYDRLINVRTRLRTITSSSDEMNKPWWKSSLEYFHNVSNASTSSHAPSNKKKLQFKRKVVSREVHVHIEKIGDMQREFQSRITIVEQYVNQHKTSSTANDSPVDKVFSNTRNFDHDSFSRFTENPDDRAALINKITDMRVDFQRRITVIEQYLKISTSTNVEKTSNEVQDCMDVDKNPSCRSDNHVKTSVESYVDNQNVDNHPMDFYHDSKTSFESDVNNHSMDFDHDPKEPNVAVENLFQEEDQQFSSKNMDVQQEALEEPNVDQQFSAKKLDAQLEMEELFAVDTLCSMIDFDIPKEQMHNQLPTEPMIPKAIVQGCNNLETAQLILTEYESQHAIHDQFDTLSMKNADSVQRSNDVKVDVNLTVAVNSLRVPLEQDFKDLFCPLNAPKTRVNVPKEIINFLRETEQHFYFPWSMDGTFVYNNFWQSLLGIGKERRGWLT
ncbi:hypothetical protein Tco_0027188 [Tanacetum coccineum]